MFNWESGINLISKCVSNEQNWTNMTELPLAIVSSPFLPEHKKGQVEENFVDIFLYNNTFLVINYLVTNQCIYF